MGANQVLKRIPRIKFPNRRAGEHLSHQVSPQTPKTESKTTETSSLFVAPPRNLGVGGKASEQPKRTPVSEKEIEAILLGGCI
ncbi:hypothetical protein SUGI_0226570 [Cryptomeria japonica]|uniref:uncharacterized protein LOC131035065 n=1 Tax=Cryptomeria japonica TaxID=3369 RepID=UPI002408C796|nr:uncharacterized protein LOC131035065 [Cryptomeria japonica]GLJ14121.1 hypothetical protein SUGI_0226570 [Cryptomeria japonica]